MLPSLNACSHFKSERVSELSKKHDYLGAWEKKKWNKKFKHCLLLYELWNILQFHNTVYFGSFWWSKLGL